MSLTRYCRSVLLFFFVVAWIMLTEADEKLNYQSTRTDESS